MTRAAASAGQLVARELAQHPTIALDELLATAELQTRVDRKYVLRADELAPVLSRLPRVRVLEIGGRRHFGYESVYFDTPALESFTPAAHPRRRRWKVRTRSYLDSGDCYLEVKTRGGRETTVKDRLEYDITDRARLTDAGLRYIEETLGAAGIAVDVHRLAPGLATDYTRTTLVLGGEASGGTASGDIPSGVAAIAGPAASRVTIDTALAWRLDGRRLDLPDRVIIETKSGGAASAMDRALWVEGHRPDRISKFATGLAALRPDLPSNRWHRVLQQHFTPGLSPSTAHPSELRSIA